MFQGGRACVIWPLFRVTSETKSSGDVLSELETFHCKTVFSHSLASPEFFLSSGNTNL